ncbi:manganese efflux pump MntP family protein [Saccharophagus degradans]|uniref:manganese efflux pump MntP n=1 Tax=Saccharophagus degradans TaxID=86304 RepID=UPI0024781FAA|nr:manganese efflux pump MntP family protein [Saccharophagus degradans]WGO99271.1 manganese efflux pump MntP family protein [Saccharophagus degradans]
MIDVVLLALALSMDAFAVSIGLGAKNKASPVVLGLKAALYFGVFQALMPLIGYLGGKGMLGWLASFAPWVAAGLLALIAAKMIYESFAEGIAEDIAQLTHRVLLLLAIATSIDALAAGFALTVLPVAPLVSCALIGVITAIFSFAGVFIGKRAGTWLESKAELAGGLVLLLIALKIIAVAG